MEQGAQGSFVSILFFSGVEPWLRSLWLMVKVIGMVIVVVVAGEMMVVVVVDGGCASKIFIVML